MRIHFVYESPVQLTPECVKSLKEYVKKKVRDIMAKYGVYEIYVEARPKGSGPPPQMPEEEGVEYGEEPSVMRKRLWFEDELERGEAGV